MTVLRDAHSDVADGQTRPVTVTALVLTRNHERHIAAALQSVLMQEYPARALDIVVVDDGSSDHTVAVAREVANAHPGRFQLIKTGGIGRGRAAALGVRAARGELIALLDGDDMWFAAKTAKQVDLFHGFAHIGAALCEATVVNDAGDRVKQMVGKTLRVIQEKTQETKIPIVSRAMQSNLASRSALMIRASLCGEPPAGVNDLEWWLTLLAANHGGIEFVPEILLAERAQPGGTRDDAGLRWREDNPAGQWSLRRWALQNLTLGAAAPAELVTCWHDLQRASESALNESPTVREASDSELQGAQQATEAADKAHATGNLGLEAALRLRAIAFVPFDLELHTAFRDAASGASTALAAPHPLRGARELVVIATAQDLINNPTMLRSYAAELADVYSLTLAIDASDLTAIDAEAELGRLVQECGLSDRTDIDLLGVAMELDAAQRHRMYARAHGLYRQYPEDHELTGLSVYTPVDLPNLRAYATGRPPDTLDVQVRELPTVTAVMPAYNYAHFIKRAIESAMQQEYPPDLLDLVVVNDGSKDETAAVARSVAERYPGRVTVISQENAGATAALDTARANARGQLIGLLDADDVWLPQKTMKQVRMMRQRPELGMVFSDMRTVDKHEASLQATIYRLPADPNLARPFARVLRSNCAINSSILIRRDLFAPLPANASYADWWLTLNAARLSNIDLIREPLALYRMHDSNLTLGATGEHRLQEGRKQVEFMLWVFRHMDLSRLSAREIPEVWGGLENFAREALTAVKSMAVSLTTVTEEGRRRARELSDEADEARNAGQISREAILRLRARAWASDDITLGDRLGDVVRRATEAAV